MKEKYRLFQPGDRVKILSHSDSALVGTYGTVVYAEHNVNIEDQEVLVNHDVTRPCLHDGGRIIVDISTPPNHGWWYFGKELQYVPQITFSNECGNLLDSIL